MPEGAKMIPYLIRVETLENHIGHPSFSGHSPRIFDEISVRESLLVLRLSDNELTKSD